MEPHVVAMNWRQAEEILRGRDEPEHREQTVDHRQRLEVAHGGGRGAGGHQTPHAQQQVDDVVNRVHGEETEQHPVGHRRGHEPQHPDQHEDHSEHPRDRRDHAALPV
jgi:hypothetical protein